MAYQDHYVHCGFEWTALSTDDVRDEDCPLCGKATSPFITDNRKIVESTSNQQIVNYILGEDSPTMETGLNNILFD